MIIENLGILNARAVRKFIVESTKPVIAAYEEKFFVFIENKKYADESRMIDWLTCWNSPPSSNYLVLSPSDNSISYKLLVDTYRECLAEPKSRDK